MKVLKLFYISLISILSLTQINAKQDEKMEIKILQWYGYIDTQKIESFKDNIKKERGIELELNLKNIIDEKVFFNMTRSQSVDIIFPGVDIATDPSFQFKKKGLVLTLDPKRIPNYKYIIEQQQKPEHLIYKDELYGIPFVSGQLSLFYNSDKIKFKNIKDIKNF